MRVITDTVNRIHKSIHLSALIVIFLLLVGMLSSHCNDDVTFGIIFFILVVIHSFMIPFFWAFVLGVLAQVRCGSIKGLIINLVTIFIYILLIILLFELNVAWDEMLLESENVHISSLMLNTIDNFKNDREKYTVIVQVVMGFIMGSGLSFLARKMDGK